MIYIYTKSILFALWMLAAATFAVQKNSPTVDGASAMPELAGRSRQPFWTKIKASDGSGKFLSSKSRNLRPGPKIGHRRQLAGAFVEKQENERETILKNMVKQPQVVQAGIRSRILDEKVKAWATDLDKFDRQQTCVLTEQIAGFDVFRGRKPPPAQGRNKRAFNIPAPSSSSRSSDVGSAHRLPDGTLSPIPDRPAEVQLGAIIEQCAKAAHKARPAADRATAKLESTRDQLEKFMKTREDPGGLMTSQLARIKRLADYARWKGPFPHEGAAQDPWWAHQVDWHRQMAMLIVVARRRGYPLTNAADPPEEFARSPEYWVPRAIRKRFQDTGSNYDIWAEQSEYPVTWHMLPSLTIVPNHGLIPTEAASQTQRRLRELDAPPHQDVTSPSSVTGRQQPNPDRNSDNSDEEEEHGWRPFRPTRRAPAHAAIDALLRGDFDRKESQLGPDVRYVQRSHRSEYV